ncbi:MAG TPA: hypothetical protein VND93_29215, partial [Myxococcales bacterium]|nr:hypothetical protein [Myxococcales bacterium]
MHARKTLRTALVAAAAILGLGSALGWRWQQPWADPAHPPRGAAWFFAPMETNAWMRVGAHASGFAVAPAYSPGGPPQRSPIEDVAVTSRHVFVAFNDGTIVRGPASGNGKWDSFQLDVARTPGPVSIAFLGDLEGYAVAGTNAVFRTTNAGESWERIKTEEALPPLFAVDAYVEGAPILWVLAERDAFWSRDAGKTWTQVRLEEPPAARAAVYQQAAEPNAPAMPPRPPGRAPPPPAGAYQVCASPIETWLVTPRASFTYGDGLQRARQGPNLVRCVLHDRDVVAVIEAGGAFWERRSIKDDWKRVDGARVSDLEWQGDSTGFSVGPAGIAPWSRTADPPVAELPWKRALRRIASSGKDSWVLDEDDSLWHAARPGGAWRRAMAFRSAITAAVELERGVLLAATSTGMLLRSEDGGAGWRVEEAFDRPVAVLARLRRSPSSWVAIPPGPEPSMGWALWGEHPAPPMDLPGDRIFAASHPDGSKTWPAGNDFQQPAMDDAVQLPSGFIQGIRALYKPGPSSPMWGAGEKCRIARAVAPYSYDDSQVPAGCAATLRDIAVVGSQGWAVGDEGTVLHSADGGSTWARVTSFPSGAALTAVLVSDGGARVTLFGDGDTIRVTEDAGRSWL